MQYLSLERKIILFICFFCLPIIVNAQKVGLVLSGGGAKGIAHIGVIKALEENGIPIDYIMGTSMGGVVGGYYAAGYSVQDMENILLSDDFQHWISGKVHQDYQYFFYHSSANASLLSLKIDFNKGFRPTLRTALVNDNTLNFALGEYLGRASAKVNCNFDSLLVPFRCLAADIFTQEAIILQDGNLNDALRATLNVPLFFNPIRVHGKYLFDGGLYNNFPVNLARQTFGVDIIIGVNVSSKTFSQYPEDDERHIADAPLYMVLAKSDSTEIDGRGVFIQPDLMEYSALDFVPVEKYLQLGYDAAMEKMPEIKAIIQRHVPQEEVQMQRADFLASLPNWHFGEIFVLGLKKHAQKYVENIFRQSQEDSLTLEYFKQKYFQLAESGRFEQLYPNFIWNEKTQRYDVALYAKPEKALKTDLGGNLSSRSISRLYLGFQYDYVRKWAYTAYLNAYSGPFYQSTETGLRVDIPTKNPFSIEPKFTYNAWNYLNISELLLSNIEKQAVLTQNDTKVSLNIATPIGKKAKLTLSVGYFRNNDRYSNALFIPPDGSMDWTRFEGMTNSLSYSTNSLSPKQFATQGSAFEFSLRHTEGWEWFTPGTTSVFTNDYAKYHQWATVKLHWEKYYNVFSTYSFGYRLEGIYSTQTVFRNYLSSMISASAFLPLLDSPTLFLTNFRNYSYIALGTIHTYKLHEKIDLRAELYGLSSYEPLYTDVSQIAFRRQGVFSDIRFTGSLGLIYKSVLGPVSLQVNYYQNAKTPWGVLLNIGYLLFNKRPLE